MGRYPTNYAIWSVMEHQGRSLAWLARRISYSNSHVKAVRAGIQPCSETFRRACAEALDIPEAVLFRLEEPAGVAG